MGFNRGDLEATCGRHAVIAVANKISITDLVQFYSCLLYTSDAADERSSVDLGGRRIIKKKKTVEET